MLPPIRVFLIRHGQTEWNQMRRAQGHTDIALDEVGREQAASLSGAFAGSNLGQVLSSDLQRAYQTATALPLNPVALRELREQSFGEWEGSDYLQIRRKFIEAGDHHDVCAPGGESKRQVWDRLASIENRLAETMFDTAVVSHGGTLSLLCARLLRGGIDLAVSFKFANAGITEMERMTDGRYRLIRYDDTAHLPQVYSDAAHGVLG